MTNSQMELLEDLILDIVQDSNEHIQKPPWEMRLEIQELFETYHDGKRVYVKSFYTDTPDEEIELDWFEYQILYNSDREYAIWIKS